jgi:hypothetical protein
MFKVTSKLKYFERNHGYEATRENGALGPFEKRETAERALVALCQAGQATSGEVVPGDCPHVDCPHKSAA